MFKTIRVRSLYQSFRDGLVEDCVRHNKPNIKLFGLIPSANMGRLHTLAVMRKMASQMAREFPGGIVHNKGHVSFTPEFLLFAKTHIGMDHTAEDAAKAWQALKGIV